MDYDAILAQVLALLQREQRLSYRVLKRRLHLDDGLRLRLSDAAKAQGTDVSTIIRQALMTALEATEARASAPPGASSDTHVHDIDICARTLLQSCLPAVQPALLTGAQVLDCSLAAVVEASLTVAVCPSGQPRPQMPWEQTPAHTAEDCAQVVVAHFPLTVQARLAEVLERTGATLMQHLPSMLQVWTDATLTVHGGLISDGLNGVPPIDSLCQPASSCTTHRLACQHQNKIQAGLGKREEPRITPTASITSSRRSASGPPGNLNGNINTATALRSR